MDVRRRLKSISCKVFIIFLFFHVSLFICGVRLCFGFSFSRKISGRSLCQVGLDREALDREGLEEGR